MDYKTTCGCCANKERIVPQLYCEGALVIECSVLGLLQPSAMQGCMLHESITGYKYVPPQQEVVL